MPPRSRKRVTAPPKAKPLAVLNPPPRSVPTLDLSRSPSSLGSEEPPKESRKKSESFLVYFTVCGGEERIWHDVQSTTIGQLDIQEFISTANQKAYDFYSSIENFTLDKITAMIKAQSSKDPPMYMSVEEPERWKKCEEVVQTIMDNAPKKLVVVDVIARYYDNSKSDIDAQVVEDGSKDKDKEKEEEEEKDIDKSKMSPVIDIDAEPPASKSKSKDKSKRKSATSQQKEKLEKVKEIEERGGSWVYKLMDLHTCTRQYCKNGMKKCLDIGDTHCPILPIHWQVWSDEVNAGKATLKEPSFELQKKIQFSYHQSEKDRNQRKKASDRYHRRSRSESLDSPPRKKASYDDRGTTAVNIIGIPQTSLGPAYPNTLPYQQQQQQQQQQLYYHHQPPAYQQQPYYYYQPLAQQQQPCYYHQPPAPPQAPPPQYQAFLSPAPAPTFQTPPVQADGQIEQSTSQSEVSDRLTQPRTPQRILPTQERIFSSPEYPHPEDDSLKLSDFTDWLQRRFPRYCAEFEEIGDTLSDEAISYSQLKGYLQDDRGPYRLREDFGIKLGLAIRMKEYIGAFKREFRDHSAALALSDLRKTPGH